MAKGHSLWWGHGAKILAYDLSFFIIQFLKSLINLNPLGDPGSTKTRNPPGLTFSHKDSIINYLSSADYNSSNT